MWQLLEKVAEILGNTVVQNEQKEIYCRLIEER